jgi:hypothetical protein
MHQMTQQQACKGAQRPVLRLPYVGLALRNQVYLVSIACMRACNASSNAALGDQVLQQSALNAPHHLSNDFAATCSVASAPGAAPGELALCVGLHHQLLPPGQGTRQGFCSSFLCGLSPGSYLRIKLISQPSFRLPFDAAAPVITIAAGAGAAPFRVSGFSLH